MTDSSNTAAPDFAALALDNGATLRRARESAGWSQRELARRAGVHQPQVVRAERGEDMQLSVLARIAAPLGLAPGLVAAAGRADAGPSSAPAQAALHDAVEDSYDSWRATWPEVDDMVAHSPERIWLTLRQMPPADLAQLSARLRALLARLEVDNGAAGKH